jgi:hypothetical protein
MQHLSMIYIQIDLGTADAQSGVLSFEVTIIEKINSTTNLMMHTYFICDKTIIR